MELERFKKEEQSRRTIRAPQKLKINKWRVREGGPVSKIQVLMMYHEIGADGQPSVELQKMKNPPNMMGLVKKRIAKEGEIVEKGAALLELDLCIHTTVMCDMCADCGADLRQDDNGTVSEASVSMIHSIPDLKVTQKLAQKMGYEDTRRLLKDRKLVLLVDLDQTVIHTTNDNVPNNIKGIFHFQLYGPHSPWYHTRLRPGTRSFLERISTFYELHICTFGARNYAHMIAKLLDPDGTLFRQRILSRDECFSATSKTDNLKALFPNGDSMVCIIDDREDVWNMASNLIQVKPYHFFQHTGDINAPPGLSKHELDGEGVDFKDISDKNEGGDSSDSTANKKEPSADTEDSNTTSEQSETAEPPTNDKDTDETNTTTVEAAETNTTTVETAETNTTTVETAETCISSKDPQDGEEKTPSKEDSTTTKDNPLEEQRMEEDEAEKAEQDIDVDGMDDQVVVSATTSAAEEKQNDTTDVPPSDTETAATSKKDDGVDMKPPTDQAKLKWHGDDHKQIDIEDPDDYLMYLEEILKHIHGRFYSIYDATQEIPDLKIIVPKIRSEVLRNQHLVFSGLVPTNMKLEQSRAYFIAKSLGANVSQNITPETTHVVAVTFTFKVSCAKKNPNIKVVNAQWLWSCAERWEHVEEKLFPLDSKSRSKNRQPPPHCHSPEHVVNYSNTSEISLSSSVQQLNASEPEKFIDTINPLLSFSNADLADMDNEFHQFFESDSSSEDEPVNIENPPVDKSLRKRKREEKVEERSRDFFNRSPGIFKNPLDAEERSENDDEEDEKDEEDDSPCVKFRRGEVPSDIEDSDSDNSDADDDGDWKLMGAALERGFLGLND